MNDGLPVLEEFLTFEGRSVNCKYIIGRRRFCLKKAQFVSGDCTCEFFEENGKAKR